MVKLKKKSKIPSGHVPFEQSRNLVQIRLLCCSKLNFNTVPMSCAAERPMITYN